MSDNYDARCPVCGSSHVDAVLELRQLPVLAVVLWRSPAEARDTARGDLLLTFCRSCGHLYNSAFEPRLIEYTPDYENSLHHSGTFQSYTADLLESLLRRHSLNGKHVLEIGCGQGDFLALLCERANCTGTGFDPGYVDAPASRTGRDRISVIRELYSSRHDVDADLIVCRQLLEHLPMPQTMLRELRRSIGDRIDTAVFFEVPNALYHLRDLDVWNLIYEHVSLYSPASLAAGFNAAGFEVCAVRELFGELFLGIEAVPARGAPGLPVDQQSARLREVTALVDGFREAAAALIRSWEKRFDEYADRNERVVVWGAGARCTNFLNLVRGSSVVEYCVDLNPRKHGTYVGGSGQKIVAPQFLVDYRPTVVILLNTMYEREIRAALDELRVPATMVGPQADILRSVTSAQDNASLNRCTGSPHPVALFADKPEAISDLEDGMADDEVNFVEAHTFEEAVQAAEATSPDVYLIGHHFDDMRPHRLIKFLRTKPWAASSPIVVVRALPLSGPGKDDEETRRSYISLGADDYVSLFDDVRRVGRNAAIRHFKSVVKRRLGNVHRPR